MNMKRWHNALLGVGTGLRAAIRFADGHRGSSCKSPNAHQFNRVIIFYKWSSENRFFSTKVSLGRKWRNYGVFW